MKDKLDDFNFGVIVCDECHYLKNQRAARTKVRYAAVENLGVFPYTWARRSLPAFVPVVPTSTVV